MYLYSTTRGTWTNLTDRTTGATPPSRQFPSMAAAGDQSLVLFGGIGNLGTTNDLFRFEPETLSWTNLSPTVRGRMPAASSAAGLACPDAAACFLFGGQADMYRSSQLFRLDLASPAWTNLAGLSVGPAPSGRSDMAFAPAGGKIYLYGGIDLNGDPLFDLFVLDTALLRWTELPPGQVSGPWPMVGDVLGFVEVGARLLLYGGSNFEPEFMVTDNTLFKLNTSTNTWAAFDGAIHGKSPDSRIWAPLVEVEGRLFMFGGRTNMYHELCHDVYVFDPSTMFWADWGTGLKGEPPSRRTQLGLGSVGGQVFVFGGYIHDGLSNELFKLDPSDISWTDLSSVTEGITPSPRHSHGFAAAGDKLYVWGGKDSFDLDQGYLQDLHMLDPFSIPILWTHLTSETVRGSPPSPRFAHGFASTLGKLYVFGGLGPHGMLNDLFRFDPEELSWTELSGAITGTMPSPRMYFGFSAPPDKNILYVYAGLGESALSDLLAINLDKMSVSNIGDLVKGTPPISRYAHTTTVFDNRLWVFGGELSGELNFVDDLFRFIALPNEFSWPANGGAYGFIDIYDWDTIVVDGDNARMARDIILCSSVFPCVLTLVGGRSGAQIQRTAGSIVCLDTDGCSQLKVNDLNFRCDGNTSSGSLINAGGSRILLANSSFSGCKSLGDGAIVRSHSGAAVTVDRCVFQDLRSARYGGAMSVVGSSVRVSGSRFIRCVSDEGGGALWASTFLCYTSPETVTSTTMEVASSDFENCGTMGSGGAVLAVSEFTDSLVLNVSVELRIESSTFLGCTATGDGGVVAATGMSVAVKIARCDFRDSQALGSGGGVSVEGSRCELSFSSFTNMSASGGGAVWVSTGAADQGHAELTVGNATFQDCMAEGSGGAIKAESNITKTSHGIHLVIGSSQFVRCRSNQGGAVRVSGRLVQVNVSDAAFKSCLSQTFGGALAVDSHSIASVSGSWFSGNKAYGRGGGALYAKSASLDLQACFCSDNASPAGGGGALLWDGDISSSTDVFGENRLHCGPGNSAAYGPCAASTYHSFEVSVNTTAAYSGLPLALSVAKKDVYGQTITTDSASLVQAVAGPGAAASLSGRVVASLRDGRTDFSVELRPPFAPVDYASSNATLLGIPSVVFHGIDAQDTAVSMQSAVVPVPFSNSGLVCPQGYVLVLDQSGLGSCLKCEPGTYSLNPLAGISLAAASCLPCPVGGRCGGSGEVSFMLGVWVAGKAFYELVGCPEGHQLVNSVSGTFNQAVQQCVPCGAGQYNLNPNSSSFTCQAWRFSEYLQVVARLLMGLDEFTAQRRLGFAAALAHSAEANVIDVMVESVIEDLSRRAGRASGGSVQVTARVGVANASAAAAVSNRMNLDGLNLQLAAEGLPSADGLSVRVVTPAAESWSLGFVFGISVASFLIFVGFSSMSYVLASKVRRHTAYASFVVACQSCKPGDEAGPQHLPPILRHEYSARYVVGKGAFGCVIRAATRVGGTAVAIKVVLSRKAHFDDRETRQLKREARALRLLTDAACDAAVHLAGVGAVHMDSSCCSFVLDFLNGEDMAAVLKAEPVSDLECISVARGVLVALALMHAEGLVHRDVKPANIFRCRRHAAGHGAVLSIPSLKKAGPPAADKEAAGHGEGSACTYKLIDFGTVLGVDEEVAQEEMLTLADHQQVGAGTPPYMSPEMFNNPQSAKYSTDLWSLGVSLFEMASGLLPFQSDSVLGWGVAVGADLDQKAPSVLDRLEEGRRSVFDHNLARVIARALEKRMTERFRTADEMHEALYQCLVNKGEAVYSVFVSYRVASEAPLAKLIFDELNHSVTPGGHRVTVYWDAFRLVKGEDWEEGFATGLLNSLCFFPIMSYGSTAPLAALPAPSLPATDSSDGKSSCEWEARPLGISRLEGLPEDREDNVLKEYIIARALLERSLALERNSTEQGCLQAAYPILVGRQNPPGHPAYPGMGAFFGINGGGGWFPTEPSPPTNRMVADFLACRAGLPADTVAQAEACSVRTAVVGLTNLQGCLLWKHHAGLAEAELTKEQAGLVGSGYAGPPVAEDWEQLTAEQLEALRGGLDLQQLRMLKAQVRSKRADFHEIIDRAVDARQRWLCNIKSSPASSPTATTATGRAAPSTFEQLAKPTVLDALLEGPAEPTAKTELTGPTATACKADLVILDGGFLAFKHKVS